MKVGIWQRVGVALVVAFLLGILGGILESNLVQGDYKDKFGTVRVPGSKDLHLPAKTIDVWYAVLLPGRGNDIPDVPVPRNLGLSVAAVDGEGPAPVVRDSVGGSDNSSAPDTDTDIRLWRVAVPREGDYRVTATGGSPLAINATLELGTGPLVPIGWVWLGALVIGILVAVFWPQLVEFPRRRRVGPPPAAVAPADGGRTLETVEARLQELDDLRTRGVLTDGEYEAERARLVDGI